ncbi:hypothetical protein PGT21_024404 [Puccinia graminis f. sp. tritici]|uniref:Uncharacterized protein n=1 Tax=Puccinia graminis f. sp. tritici TaxID=56615 RepID=A0A5B0MS19_PUCGR|nr:hypothetical protein PGT21_024404 [Puccinia graminis f. sp. tritici]KAA1078904.1 hypothetical protein PGTUg99_019297 [Puccinia graminis f. sp. tritici]
MMCSVRKLSREPFKIHENSLSSKSGLVKIIVRKAQLSVSIDLWMVSIVLTGHPERLTNSIVSRDSHFENSRLTTPSARHSNLLDLKGGYWKRQNR